MYGGISNGTTDSGRYGTRKKTEYDLIDRVRRVAEETGKTPCLATILVGDDPSSVVYVRMKVNACARVGISSRKIELPAGTTTEELLHVIETLNTDESVNGILLQHPVPRHIDELRCFDAIAREKDVDGVNTASFGGYGDAGACIQERDADGDSFDTHTLWDRTCRKTCGCHRPQRNSREARRDATPERRRNSDGVSFEDKKSPGSRSSGGHYRRRGRQAGVCNG